MKFLDLLPVMIYDDTCYHCCRLASVVKRFTGKRILIVGHYTELGKKIKAEIFPENYDSTRMFWFITNTVAYGGRAAILPLILSIFKRTKKSRPTDFTLSYGSDCQTPRAFLARVKTLLSNSEKISLNL